MNKYRFHHIGLVHLPLSKTFMSCAFTQKLHKVNLMLLSLGHEVYFYGARGENEHIEDIYNSENFHFVETHTLSDIRKDYSVGYNLPDANGLGYPWREQDFKHDFSTERKQSTLKFYAACIIHINLIKKPDDFLLLTQGTYQKPIRDSVHLTLNCEPGIGYRGSLSDNKRAFESSYIQNFTMGSEHPYQSINGDYYARVIPNYVDSNDVEFSAEKEDYYFFIGRMILRKGILTAAETCKALGKKLIIAGQGAHVDERGHLVPNEDPDFDLPPGTWEYVGYCDVEQRKKYMSKAIAVFVPTIYMETFGGVHTEAMLHGTPVISTNFAVFPGTIPDIVDGMHHMTDVKKCVGFRCNTLQDFVDAAKKAKDVDPYFIRSYSERYLMDNVRWEFQKWFDDLMQWYRSTDGKTKGWSYLKEN